MNKVRRKNPGHTSIKPRVRKSPVKKVAISRKILTSQALDTRKTTGIGDRAQDRLVEDLPWTRMKISCCLKSLQRNDHLFTTSLTMDPANGKRGIRISSQSHSLFTEPRPQHPPKLDCPRVTFSSTLWSGPASGTGNGWRKKRKRGKV